MNTLFYRVVLSIFLLSGFIHSQDSTKIIELEQRIKQLEEKLEKTELESILTDAEKVSNYISDTTDSKIFKSGQRSLQAINPEISLTGDAFGQFILNKDTFTDEARSGAHFRVVGMHIQSNLDPYSFAKAIIEFTPNGVGFGEAYMTINNIVPNINLTLGKFRQQFGIINRWHEHALDQFDFPLALKTILGEEGINQTGISADWLLPTIIGDANNLKVEITNGQSDHLFAGEFFSFPTILARFNSYSDLTQNVYLEFGLSGMLGTNNIKGYSEGINISEKNRYTTLGGFDLTLFWEPLNQAKYNSFIWRTEIYYADKDQLAGSNISTFGGYSYAEYKFTERWQTGARFDYTQPFETGNKGKYLYQVVPYLTWWQSPWVKLRLQYNYLNGNNLDLSNSTLRFQIVWAMGPHKHDRY
jgi:hypothetical protein